MASKMAARASMRFINSALRPSSAVKPFLLRPYPRLPRTLSPTVTRYYAHTIPKPRAGNQQHGSSSSEPATQEKSRKLQEPHYELTFTCVPCGERSKHVISKQGYHKGSVLIACPGCKNRHIISDNLNIFGERKLTVEDIMREKGQLVKRGTLSEDGDLEFWEDGTATERDSNAASKPATSAEDVAKGLSSPADENAAQLRQARDPSSQSAEPTLDAASTPLGNTGSRPTVDSGSHDQAVPSTRRQYSTKVSDSATSEDDSVPQDAISTLENSSQVHDQLIGSEEFVPLNFRRKANGPLGARARRLFKSGQRLPVRKRYPGRSALDRLPLEVHKSRNVLIQKQAPRIVKVPQDSKPDWRRADTQEPGDDKHARRFLGIRKVAYPPLESPGSDTEIDSRIQDKRKSDELVGRVVPIGPARGVRVRHVALFTPTITPHSYSVAQNRPRSPHVTARRSDLESGTYATPINEKETHRTEKASRPKLPNTDIKATSDLWGDPDLSNEIRRLIQRSTARGRTNSGN
ncbi:DNL zinc finger-domain-containing protein [Xylariaceae sp. FL0016]|nr:DNL zinc finger-domain-containing protein [Xylariaceae sp. FL0016]